MSSSLVKPVSIELNEQFKKVLDLLEQTDTNVFITGKAGTGKSTLLSYFRFHTKKKVVVLAPTGVAAINVAGQTIHSFFRFKPDITLDKVRKASDQKNSIYQKMDVLVIDEISMVRADLLDCVDKFLRLNGRDKDVPFGGVQLVFIGDLYQLPPVVVGEDRKIFRLLYESEYFFSAKVMEQLKLELIELEKIYRQKDNDFISLLNSVRNNTVTDEYIEILNSRLNPGFSETAGEFYIYLTTTNASADEINREKLGKLKTKLYSFDAEITGDFDRKSFPTESILEIKTGSQVMMLNNDSQKRWVNGTVGKVVKIEFDKDCESDVMLVEMENGQVEEVLPHTWEMYKYKFDEKKGQIDSDTVGTFTQYPLKLAWAVTIHKSQGKTFQKVIVDIGNGAFSHGQVYVALSRCTSFEGLVLKKRIEKKHIFMDFRVRKFLTSFQYQKSDKEFSLEKKIELLERVVKDKKKLEMLYLKASDEKSRRIFEPQMVGEMNYNGKIFLGVSGFDHKSGEERNFRVDRILEMKII